MEIVGGGARADNGSAHVASQRSGSSLGKACNCRSSIQDSVLQAYRGSRLGFSSAAEALKRPITSTVLQSLP